MFAPAISTRPNHPTTTTALLRGNNQPVDLDLPAISFREKINFDYLTGQMLHSTGRSYTSSQSRRDPGK